MRRTRVQRRASWRWSLATMWVAASLATAAYLLTAPGLAAGTDHRVLGPGPVTITLEVNHSRFTPARVVVREHTAVTFRVVNHDPIGHEFIMGDAEVHARHEAGTEAHHGAVAGEVSVAPGATATTTYVFHTPGAVVFACHLPGHFAFGMVGEVVVRPRQRS